jgi:hypothetical protein
MNDFLFILLPTGLSYNEWKVVKSMYKNQAMNIDEDGIQVDVNSAPPGDEGVDISHAGGEHEAFEVLEGGEWHVRRFLENFTPAHSTFQLSC